MPAAARRWISSQNSRRAHRALDDLPGVIAVAQIGTSLRVLGNGEGDLKEHIEARLRETGTAKVEPTPPNLEDVFVAATVKAREPAREPA